jgi:hypothetical protein
MPCFGDGGPETEVVMFGKRASNSCTKAGIRATAPMNEERRKATEGSLSGFSVQLHKTL